MLFESRDDWPLVRQRYEAWWQGEVVDRPPIKITAPKESPNPQPKWNDEVDVLDWYINPDYVLPRLEQEIAATYFAGDAFPLVYPVSLNMVAIQAAYLGCPYHLSKDTAWAEPIIHDWDNAPKLEVQPDNAWWQCSQRLLNAGAAASQGRYCVGIPDLQGGGQILALLRGTEQLATDLIDCPKRIKPAIEKINAAWLYYYQTCCDIIHRYIDGYIDSMGLWSDTPAVTVECDFSCLISAAMFREHFLPAVEQQTQWIGRSIYHLDGPGALQHLDALLSLPTLTGIQWQQGAGGGPMTAWLPLLRRIQDAGKIQVIACASWELETLLTALRPEGILLSTHCESPAEADALLAKATSLFASGQAGRSSMLQ